MFMMMFAVFVAIVCLFSQAKARPMTVGEMSAITCISSHNLQGYAEKIAVFVTQDKAPTDDKKLNKFMGCHWKNKGLIDEAGNINADNLRTYLETIFANGSTVTATHTQIAQSVIDRCKNIKGKDPGQNAVIVQNCITATLSDYD